MTLPREFRETLVSVSNVCCELCRRHLDSFSTFKVRQGERSTFDFLLRVFICQQRINTLCWRERGSDAAVVTKERRFQNVAGKCTTACLRGDFREEASSSLMMS